MTDSSGAALVGATVTVTNEGTNTSQNTVSDAQGRYSVRELPIGTYDIKATLSGFETVVHTGISLTVGATPIVDFTLQVGKITETINVEGQVSQVETQTAAVSTLVSEQQVSQLPLNGRDYTQLMELAPGVQVINNGASGGGVAGAFYGAQQNFSISGSRPEGQGFLIDNEDVRDFWEHGPGSAALGTTLGIEAMQEFQVLTGTYGAQFAGNGAILNAATKQGTIALHGSVYEFLRNSALDSRNFFDFQNNGTIKPTPTAKPEFRRNQFGASAGGPIVKDKLFFFGNYEGLRDSTGQTNNTSVPEPYVALNELPCGQPNTPNNLIAPLPAPCVPLAPAPGGVWGTANTPANPVEPLPAAIGSGAGTQAAAAAATIRGVLALYPAPASTAPSADLGGYSGYTTTGAVVANENYFVGRVDYLFSDKDSVFARYVSDRANRLNPFGGSLVLPDWPEKDNTANQYLTIQERRIVSPTVINQARFNFTRTFETAMTTTAPNPVLQFVPGFPDGTIAGCSGCTPLGANTGLPYDIAQDKIGVGDDLVWSHGAHSFKVGIAITRVLSNISAPFVNGGSWSFLSSQGFLAGQPYFILGTYPGHNNSGRNFKETDYSPYFEDDWKVTSKLTLNLGIRYDFATNPIGDVAGNGGPLNTIVNNPFADQTPYYTDALGHAYANGFTPVRHVFASNPNAANFEPRIGMAYDPFADHKTSIRAGFGVFHDQIAPRLYASNYYLAPPYASALNVAFFLPFPNPFPTFVPGGPTGQITEFAGVDYQTSNSPYEMQYDLTIQREIFHGTVLSVGYVGSQGRNLFSEVDRNPPKCTTYPNCSNPATVQFTTGGLTNPRIDSTINPATGVPYFSSLSTATAQQTSNYNSLQVALNHQFSHNFSGQASYTYSKCLTTGSASSGLEQGIFEQADPYNRFYDYGRCSFDIRGSFVANGVYNLPFKGNRLVQGWQVTSILRLNTGLPVDVQEASDVAGLAAIQGDRPNYSGTCPGGRDQILGKWYDWANVDCYASQPVGMLGNVPRGSVTGPGVANLDFSLLKNTKLWERLDTQFRAEFFNLANHTNFALPAMGGVIVAAPGPPGHYTQAAQGLPGQAGSIGATSTIARQIQFALKLTF
jgi:hypothetical protein